MAERDRICTAGDCAQKRTVEILAPAGSYESFRAALGAGADAVYAGGPRFGARAFADNFTQEELVRAVGEAHLFGKKFYLTVNTLLRTMRSLISTIIWSRSMRPGWTRSSYRMPVWSSI